MARRKKSKVESLFLGVALVVAIIGWIIEKILDSIGMVAPIAVIVLIVAGVICFKYAGRQKRIRYLLDKYGNQEIVDRILLTSLAGANIQQLLDSLGNPLNVDRKLMASRRREVWKYNSIGRGRYGLRITLDDDIVIRIDHKSS
jgi:hypothetical protein